MRITRLNTFTFGNSTKTFKLGNNQVEEDYNDNNILIKRLETDEFSRNVDTQWFNDDGKLTARLHKDYYEKENESGFVETYKDDSQEYTRKSYTKIQNGEKHHVDDFQSKTGKSYVNEFVRDMQDKLIRIITNGETIEF